MDEPVRIIFVEDEPADLELIERALHRAGVAYSARAVQSEEEFRAALRNDVDVILADYTFPGLGGVRAIEIRDAEHCTAPLIIVSGAIDPVSAVELMRLGAADYVMKDALERLPAAVASAIDRRRLYRERARALQELEARQEDLRATIDLLRATDDQRLRLLAYVVDAQEAERVRIAEDVHDGPIQALGALDLRLEVLRRELPDERLSAKVGDIQTTVLRCIESMRRLVFDLRPPMLDRDGLVPALRAYIEASGFPFECRVLDGNGAEPPVPIRVKMFRIAQEALSNVRKHAAAHHVDINVDERQEGWSLRIVDDGVGFVSDAPRVGHIGLASMVERAELAGGWCRVSSAAGAGTTVEAWLPTAGGAKTARLSA